MKQTNEDKNVRITFWSHLFRENVLPLDVYCKCQRYHVAKPSLNYNDSNSHSICEIDFARNHYTAEKFATSAQKNTPIYSLYQISEKKKLKIDLPFRRMQIANLFITRCSLKLVLMQNFLTW